MTRKAGAKSGAWQQCKWLSWAGLALAVSPWGCGGTEHGSEPPLNQAGASGQAGSLGVSGTGYAGGVPEAGYPGAQGGGPSGSGGGGPSGSGGGGPSGSGGAPVFNGGSTGVSTGGAWPTAGAPPTGDCDGDELTIRTQADADRYSGCSRINGVYAADVADPLVIDWPLLTTLNGELHFARDAGLTRISLPNLRQINGELYLKGNPVLKVVEVPGLVKISGDPDLNSAIFVEDNAELMTFTLSLDLRVNGLTAVTENPLLCDAENLVSLSSSGALYPSQINLPACAYPPDPGAGGAGGNADF
jgi:hypothetical protein